MADDRIEERLREIQARRDAALARGTWSMWEVGALVHKDVAWLIAELRAARVHDSCPASPAVSPAVASVGTQEG